MADLPSYYPDIDKSAADIARNQAAAQDMSSRKSRTGSVNPTFDPASPVPPAYSADATKPTALNPLGQNTNTGAQNYLTAPSNVPGATMDVPTPNAGYTTLPPTLAPPVSRPNFGDGRSTSVSRPIPTAGDASAISGTPRAVFNGREVSQDEINRLANTNVISSEAFRNPGIGTLGVPVSPQQGITAAAQNIQRPTPTYDADAALQDAQRNARSDVASIINRDPRSALGVTARNAGVDRSWNLATNGSSPRRRLGADAAYQNQIDALLQQAGQGTQDARAVALQRSQEANQQALEGSRQAAENQRAALSADTQRFDALLRRPLPQQIRQADGTLGLLGPDGMVRPAMTPNGQPVSEWIGKPPEEIASLNKMVNERVNTLLGVDPLTGMITDANGQKRRPTATELQQADAAARETFTGGRPQQARATTSGRPTLDQFLASARSANPGVSDSQLADYYKKNYGG